MRTKGRRPVATARYEDSAQTTVTNGSTASTDDTKSASGAAYVYKRTASSWAHQAYLKASNADAGDLYGYRMPLDGDYVLVGALSEDSRATTITNGSGSSSDDTSADSGAGYVYKRTASSWAQERLSKSSQYVR